MSEKKIYNKTKKILFKHFSNEKRLKNLLFEIMKSVTEKGEDAFETYAKISKKILMEHSFAYKDFPNNCTDGIKSGDAVSMAIGVTYIIMMRCASELNII